MGGFRCGGSRIRALSRLSFSQPHMDLPKSLQLGKEKLEKAHILYFHFLAFFSILTRGYVS